MNFEKDHIYHIYNQGNNKQKIFFIKENYYFFIGKIKTHVLPFADILAWCLMPNHFHIMVYVNYPELTAGLTDNNTGQALHETVGVTDSRVGQALHETHPKTPSHRLDKVLNETVGVTDNSEGQALHETHPMTPSHRMSASLSLNNSIAVLLRSYTRAINKQENRTGSLFKPHTKAECLTNSSGITPAFFNTKNGTLINIPCNAKEYPQICFNYIHNNPVKAGLVNNPEEWEFSSFREFLGDGILVNKTRVMKLELKYLPDIDL